MIRTYHRSPTKAAVLFGLLLVIHCTNATAESPPGNVEVFQANSQWRPIHWEPARIIKGSALDFSSFLDAPAGKHGAVVCRDGRFVFSGAPERPVRLYGVAVCFAGSLDGRVLTDSRRVLLLYLTDLKGTDTEVEYEQQPKDSVLVRKAGKLPLLVRQGKIELTFQIKGRPLPQVWALKYDGTRAVQIEPRQAANGFSFEAQAVTNPETFSAYELHWN